MNRDGGLAQTTWLIWGAAASLPLLTGRNPFPLAVVIAAVATVRIVCASRNPNGMPLSLVIRAGLLLAAVSVIFNVLTVRAGNLVIVAVPGWAGWLAGDLTWNAVIFGLLSAIAILGLIVTWATVAAAIDWAGLTRILPDRLLGFAVGGSIALNLIPQTVASLGEIREAAAARGFGVKGPRSLAALVSPVLTGSMERALRLSEVLDARGFGSREAGPHPRGPLRQFALNALLAGSCLAAYALVVGAMSYAVGGVAISVAGALILMRTSRPSSIRRTRYRVETRSRGDWLVMAGALVSLGASVVARDSNGNLLLYEPYPRVTMPEASVWLLVALFGLFMPATVGSGPSRRD